MKEEQREALGRSIECRRCDVEAGEPCRDKSGTVLPRVHQLRVIDAGGSSVLSPGTTAPDIGKNVNDVVTIASGVVVDVSKEVTAAAREVVTSDGFKLALRGALADVVMSGVRGMFNAGAPPAAPKGAIEVQSKCGSCGAALVTRVNGQRFEGSHMPSCSTLPKDKRTCRVCGGRKSVLRSVEETVVDEECQACAATGREP